MPVDVEVFLSHVNSDDQLTMVVRSHQYLDVLLTEVINEVLVESHFLEVERIPFPVKVELSVALGKVSADVRSPLLKFNAIRNDFAHDPATKLTEKDARDFYNVFDSWDMRNKVVHRTVNSLPDSINQMRRLISLLYVYLSSTAESLRDEKLWHLATMEEVDDVLKYSPVGDDAITTRTHDRIKGRFERLRKERDSTD